MKCVFQISSYGWMKIGPTPDDAIKFGEERAV